MVKNKCFNTEKNENIKFIESNQIIKNLSPNKNYDYIKDDLYNEYIKILEDDLN